MPLPLRNWQLAADEVGKTFNPNEHDHPLGYFLPDPKMIANAGLSSERTITRNKWIANWLRLRDVLIFRLTSELVSDLTPAKWKSILGLGYFSYKSNQASKGKAAIEKALEDTLGEMKNNIKIDRLGDLPVRWDGKDLDVDTADVAVLRRVL
ncbi:hypothetical protein Moror_10185 [Moniliophthora roreri MCA 2997]|uniref:Uncharacterized protein n=1 Tax=Moniliophthora roreri (strain MCA 2997) TaxID=1381753 RepID=V2XY68_MONRO|nr:hypothetical protein Moror_10185 [Moniliophthora roreri MCA 2997]